MPRFRPGKREAIKARGKTKKPVIAHLLEQFAPRVITVVEEMLTSPDPQMRWTCAKEILPYLWPKKAAVAVQEEKPVPSLAEYLAVKQNGHTTQPEPPSDNSRSDGRPESVSAPVSLA
ncbi:MAG TPA: hypothetical protein VGX03_24160 [Candidatus Binatia bacterium]|jgi:hypothetical protein|nr:hypothetical protein [Candidatus Binatia bacterium]